MVSRYAVFFQTIFKVLNYSVLNFDIRKMNPYEHITVKLDLSGTKQNATLQSRFNLTQPVKCAKIILQF